MTMAKALHLPIWRDAQRLLVWTETVVRGFARCHKYTVGNPERVFSVALGHFLNLLVSGFDDVVRIGERKEDML